jgi:hypothetical protein
MSLTTFLKIEDVREKFVQQFPKPRFNLKKEILVPPKTKRYSLIGTAFDYLLRFYIKRLNPEAITKRWVAEHSLTNPLSPVHRSAGDNVMVVVNENTGEVRWADSKTYEPIPFTGLALRISNIIRQAKSIYLDYLESGQMTDEVIRNALLLAQLDPIYRAGYIDENIGRIDDNDVADLRELISLVNPQTFTAQEYCMLNPTFGEASRLVGGADADLIIDDMLVDVKTVKDLKLTRDYFLQLMGYYVLYRIGGIDHAPHSLSISRVGIYYSRYAELYSFNISDVIDPETLSPFMEWVKERPSRQNP